MESKDDFTRVLRAWYAYANRMYLWVHHMFPWAAGATLRRRDGDELRRLGEIGAQRGDVAAYFDEFADELLEWKTRR